MMPILGASLRAGPINLPIKTPLSARTFDRFAPSLCFCASQNGAALGAPARRVSRETSFPDAEPSEQRIQHILHPGPPGDAIERARCKAQALGKQDQVARFLRYRSDRQPLARFSKRRALARAPRRGPKHPSLTPN